MEMYFSNQTKDFEEYLLLPFKSEKDAILKQN